jgi:hypothetical protein
MDGCWCVAAAAAPEELLHGLGGHRLQHNQQGGGGRGRGHRWERQLPLALAVCEAHGAAGGALASAALLSGCTACETGWQM